MRTFRIVLRALGAFELVAYRQAKNLQEVLDLCSKSKDNQVIRIQHVYADGRKRLVYEKDFLNE